MSEHDSDWQDLDIQNLPAQLDETNNRLVVIEQYLKNIDRNISVISIPYWLLLIGIVIGAVFMLVLLVVTLFSLG